MTLDSSLPGADLPFSRDPRDPEPGVGHRIALVSAVDPALLELAALSLHGEDALVLAVTIHPDEGPDGVVRLTSTETAVPAGPAGLTAPDGEGSSACAPAPALPEPVVLDVDMPTPCPTCSLREVLLAVAEDRAADEPGGATVILLPPAIEIVHLVPRLAAELEGVPGATLAGVAHAVLTSTAVDDILTHIPLAVRGLAWGEGDARCTGEVHMLGLGYADVVVALVDAHNHDRRLVLCDQQILLVLLRHTVEQTALREVGTGSGGNEERHNDTDQDVRPNAFFGCSSLGW